ncbi:MAG: shikimate dehydrogenase [Alphaproteobacteria bacterium]|nr:shikimate dehydrogenase [Alphaproteobacteria bacterium]
MSFVKNLLKLAVLGCPIGHSLSPKMHRYWLRQYDLFGDYEACETDGSQAEFFTKIRALKQGGFVGCNITIPHKQHAYALCDQYSPEADLMGAVNTMHVHEDKIIGYNTDVYGFSTNLRQHVLYEMARDTRQALVVGAGGTTRAVLYALLQDGFDDILLLNRSIAKAEQLIDLYHSVFPNSTLQVNSLDKLNTCLRQRCPQSLIVNTTSIGMSGQDTWLVQFPKPFLVTDIVYAPIVTPFLQCADDSGLAFQDGFGMLMHQGAESFRLWTGILPTVDNDLRNYLLR